MINKLYQKESKNNKNSRKNYLLSMFMGIILSTQAQVSDALDNQNDFKYYEKVGSEIQEDKMKMISNMQSKYQKFLNKYLESKFKNGVDKGLLALVQAYGDKIEFINFLDYLILNNPEDLDEDDLYQLAALKNETIKLREEIEDLGTKDFEIIDGNIGSYNFRGSDSFEYLGRNYYKVKIDFDKIKRHKLTSWLNIKETYTKEDSFFIHYNGNNVIKYYSGRSFSKKKLLGHQVIDHKFEIIKKGNTFYRRGATENVYISELGMNLKIKFFEKRQKADY